MHGYHLESILFYSESDYGFQHARNIESDTIDYKCWIAMSYYFDIVSFKTFGAVTTHQADCI
jgi:hypothetical protein